MAKGPELLKDVMIKMLKSRAKDEDMLADEAYAEMQKEGSGPKARKASENMKKHQYARIQFLQLAKQLEEEQ